MWRRTRVKGFEGELEVKRSTLLLRGGSNGRFGMLLLCRKALVFGVRVCLLRGCVEGENAGRGRSGLMPDGVWVVEKKKKGRVLLLCLFKAEEFRTRSRIKLNCLQMQLN